MSRNGNDREAPIKSVIRRCSRTSMVRCNDQKSVRFNLGAYDEERNTVVVVLEREMIQPLKLRKSKMTGAMKILTRRVMNATAPDAATKIVKILKKKEKKKRKKKKLKVCGNGTSSPPRPPSNVWDTFNYVFGEY
ncbi:hypothetical protein ACLB2K_064537 [Fragaria x ananassa]